MCKPSTDYMRPIGKGTELVQDGAAKKRKARKTTTKKRTTTKRKTTTKKRTTTKRKTTTKKRKQRGGGQYSTGSTGLVPVGESNPSMLAGNGYNASAVAETLTGAGPAPEYNASWTDAFLAKNFGVTYATTAGGAKKRKTATKKRKTTTKPKVLRRRKTVKKSTASKKRTKRGGGAAEGATGMPLQFYGEPQSTGSSCAGSEGDQMTGLRPCAVQRGGVSVPDMSQHDRDMNVHLGELHGMVGKLGVHVKGTEAAGGKKKRKTTTKRKTATKKRKTVTKKRKTTTKRKQRGGAASDWGFSQYSRGPSNTLTSIKNDPALFGQFNTNQQYIAPQDLAKFATPALVGQAGEVVPNDPDAGLQGAVGGKKRRRTATKKRKTATKKRKTVTKRKTATKKRKTATKKRKTTTKRKTVRKTTTKRRTTRKPKSVMNKIKSLFK